MYWALGGLLLIIVEVLSGTFYLLVIGVAAFAGAGVALSGGGFAVQAIAATLMAIAGVFLVHNRRLGRGLVDAPGNDFDKGQRVTIDEWINEAEGIARVRYRGTLWDARVTGARISGHDFVIQKVDGNTLLIAQQP
jgi:membrane protein implicated in regulation of membrane protease activity